MANYFECPNYRKGPNACCGAWHERDRQKRIEKTIVVEKTNGGTVEIPAYILDPVEARGNEWVTYKHESGEVVSYTIMLFGLTQATRDRLAKVHPGLFTMPMQTGCPFRR